MFNLPTELVQHIFEFCIDKRLSWNKLIEQFDAVNFVKLSSKIIGGQGGGGRKDFAQAGGLDQNKIMEAFEKLKTLI